MPSRPCRARAKAGMKPAPAPGTGRDGCESIAWLCGGGGGGVAAWVVGWGSDDREPSGRTAAVGNDGRRTFQNPVTAALAVNGASGAAASAGPAADTPRTRRRTALGAP